MNERLTDTAASENIRELTTLNDYMEQINELPDTFDEMNLDDLECMKSSRKIANDTKENTSDYTYGSYIATDGSYKGMTRPERLDTSRSDAIENNSDIIGEPLEDMKNHHKQEKDFSCAIACQEFAVESLTGQELEESELRDKGEKYGYSDTGGTPFSQAGKVTEEYGLHSEFHNSIFGDSLTLDTAMEKIENNEKIIAAVDTSMLYYPNSSSSPFLIPQPNHAVEIIGFDKSNPNDVKVIINDPGFEDGAGNMYSWDTFKNCCSDSFISVSKQ